MKRQLHIRIEEKLLILLIKKAKTEHRSLSNLINYLLIQKLKQGE